MFDELSLAEKWTTDPEMSKTDVEDLSFVALVNRGWSVGAGYGYFDCIWQVVGRICEFPSFFKASGPIGKESIDS